MKIIKFAVVTLGFLGLLTLTPLTMRSANAALDCGGTGTAAGGNIAKCLDAGACLGNAASCPAQDKATSRVNDIASLALNVLSVIVGLAAVIMIIIGGFKYVISGGESSNVAGAKNTIIYAIVGLIIVVLAQVIVKFVLHKAAG